MRTHLRLFCLLSTFGLMALSACAAVGTDPGTAPGTNGLGGKADDASDDQACVARGGEYDGVEFTRREAELVLELANKGSQDVLDVAVGAGLDADTVANILAARDAAGSFCTVSELAAVAQVGPANLERARQFTAVWEISEAGDVTVEDLMRDGGTYDGTRFTAGEAFITLEMATYASVSQLDAIPYFRSDAAQNLVRARRTRGGFSSLSEVAEVFGVGSRHMEYLRGGMADWRIFARAAHQQCGALDAADGIPESLTTVCPSLAIEGQTLAGDLEGVAFTQEEAALTLDFVNTADVRTIDEVLDARAAQAIVAERGRDTICDLTRLGNLYYVGPAGLTNLRRFSATWEAYKAGEGTLTELMAPATREVDGVAPLNVHELALVLDMANTATEEQLDAIPYFRSDAARNVTNVTGYMRSLADVAATHQVGPAHINYLVRNVNDWRAFLRETEERPACAAFGRDPGLDTPTESILTSREAEEVRDSLDDICGDSWCEGDYNWYVDSVECPGDGTCVVTQHVQEHGGGWSSDVLAGRSEESLQSYAEGDYGGFAASIDDRYTDEDGTWLTVSCNLDSGFFAREDAMEVGSGDYSEKLYFSLMDCVSALEGMMYSL
ncbi:MAG: hypothetical protein DRJ42_18830 [Deltaproteobacteria bacterium]|nr:MAG: hypothetical protein DRJ42_18830 [Deltaproteobacteria bacterium]